MQIKQILLISSLFVFYSLGYSQDNSFNMCETSMTDALTGTLYDSGGEFGDYGLNEACYFLIQPPCGYAITITIDSLDLESYDILEIYKGTNSSTSPVFNSGYPYSTYTIYGGSVYIKWNSDFSVTQSGFKISWTSEGPSFAPEAKFKILHPISRPFNTPIVFINESWKSPCMYQWDFGDGNTSDAFRPVHQYSEPGDYTVTLIALNLFSSDTISHDITVQEPALVSAYPTDTLNSSLVCGQQLTETFTIYNDGNGDLAVEFPPGETEWLQCDRFGQEYIVHPEDSMVVHLNIFGEGLAAGNYQSVLEILTNDVENSVFEYTITLNVSGEAVMDASTAEINYSPIIQGLLNRDTLIVNNVSCGQLTLSAGLSSSSFSVSPNALSIPAYSQDTLYVNFLSEIPGVYTDSLLLASNVNDITVPLSAEAIGAPIISVNQPDTIQTSIHCGTSDSTTFTIYNTGASDLIVEHIGLGKPLCFERRVIALKTLVTDEIRYQNTIDAINTHFTNYSLLESTAQTSAELATELTDASILLVPWQDSDPGILFTNLSNAFHTFLSHGGKILICGNKKVQETGLFTAANPYDSYINLVLPNSQPLHPIMDGVPEYFGDYDGGYRYWWEPDSALIHLVSKPNNSKTIVGIKPYSNGEVVYVGFRYTSITDMNSLILGNAMAYLINPNTNVWAEISSFNAPATIPAGDSLEFTMNFNAVNLVKGSYYSNFQLASNDPSTPALQYTVHLNVEGDPIAGIAADDIVFEPNIAGFEQQDTLIITNTGCDSLFVSAEVSLVEFSVSPDSLYIPPFGQDTLFVKFHTTTPGSFSSELIVTTNGGNETISLFGQALEAPEINIAPADTLFAQISCSASDSVTFTIYNDGENDLTIKNTNADGTTGEGVNVLLVNTLGATTDGIPISLPQYNNTLAILNSQNLNFNLTISENYYEYYTDDKLENIDIVILPSLHPFWAGLLFGDGLVDFVNNGGKVIICSNEKLYLSDLFPVIQNAISIPQVVKTNTTHPIAKGVDADFWEPNSIVYKWIDSDPEVEGIFETFNPFSPNNNTAVGEKVIGEGRVIYIAFSYSAITQNNSKILGNSVRYLTSLTHPDWAESSFFNATDTIAPGDSLEINVHLNSDGLTAGNYYLDPAFSTNDPEHPIQNYVIQMEVLGSAELATSVDEIIFEPLITGFSVQDTIIVSNTGCDSLIAEVELSALGFSINPQSIIIPAFSEDTLFVSFQPPSPGIYSGEVTLTSNGGNKNIFLSAEGLDFPILTTSPTDTLHVNATCGYPDTVSVTINNSGLEPLVLLDNFDDSPPVTMLALTSHVNIDGAYANTIDAINTQFTNYTLSTSNALWEEDFAADLEGIDILLIPSQSASAGTDQFQHLHGAIIDFLENGGLVLACGSYGFSHSGAFPFPESTHFGNGNLTFYNADSSHPIMNNVPDSIAEGGVLSYGFDWYQDESIEKLAIIPYNEEAVVAVKDYGPGESVYIGFTFEEPTDVHSLILGNAVKYLESLKDPFRIKNNAFDLPVTIPPGDSFELELIIDARQLGGGDYFSNYKLLTNDPANDSLSIVVHLNSVSEPSLEVSATEYAFEPTFIGNTVNDTLIINNKGCLDLVINANLASSHFSISQTEVTIPAYSCDTMYIQFHPLEASQLSSEILLETNTGDFIISLSGEGWPAPEVLLAPNELFLNGEVCSDSALVTFDIQNIGESPLEYQIYTESTEPELETTLAALTSNYSQITALIPNIYIIPYGMGNGWFDSYYLHATGPTLEFHTDGSSVVPTGSTIISSPDPEMNERYFTAKLPGFMVIAKDIKNTSYFKSLTLFNNSEIPEVQLQQDLSYTSLNGIVYRGFTSRISYFGTTTMNQIIITEDLPDIEFDSNESPDWNTRELSGLENSNRIYYVFFATGPSMVVSDATMQAVFEQFIDIVQNEHNLNTSISGQLSQNESTEISFYSNTTDFEGGLYEIPIIIGTNDPIQPKDTVLVHLTVPNNVCVDFEYDRDIGCGNYISFTDLTLNNPDTWTWDFGDGSTSNEQNPVHPYTEPGTYTATLEACNGTDCNTMSQDINIETASLIAPPDCIPAEIDSYSFIGFTEIEFAGQDLPIASDTLVYHSYACETPFPLELGHDYSMNVGISETNFTNNAVKCWIDYNNDGIFSPEEIVVENLDVVLETSADFTIWEEAAVGIPLRMRMMIVINGGGPCFHDLGKVIDYAIRIEPSPPITQFDYTVQNECDRVFNFTDQSAILPNGWLWDFGDGNTSAVQNPVHTYADNGNYEVTLVCSNIYGSSLVQQNLETQVSGFSDIVVNNNPVVNQNIDFTATAIDVDTWNWDFGDGSTLTTTSPNASHTYTSVGTYTISISTPDSFCVTELSQEIVVSSIDSDGLVSVKQEISIYPNPSEGLFRISFSDDIKVKEISLFDALGRSIKFNSEQISQNEIDINVNRPVAGVYLLSMRTKSGSIIKKRLVME